MSLDKHMCEHSCMQWVFEILGSRISGQEFLVGLGLMLLIFPENKKLFTSPELFLS